MGKLFTNDDSLDYNDDAGRWYYAPTPTKDPNRPSDEEINRQVDELIKELSVKKIIVHDHDNYAHNSMRMCAYECCGLFIDDTASQEQIKEAFEKQGDWRNSNEGFHFDRLNEVKVVDGKIHWVISVKPGYRRLNAFVPSEKRGWFRYSGTVEVNVAETLAKIQELGQYKYTPSALTMRDHWDRVLQVLACKIYNQYLDMDPIDTWDSFGDELYDHIVRMMSDYGKMKFDSKKKTVDDVAMAINDFANKFIKPLNIPYTPIYRMVERDKEHNKWRYWNY